MRLEKLNECWTQYNEVQSELETMDVAEAEDREIFENIFFLVSTLIEKAAEVIHSLEISESNYMVAWTMLKERYDNKRLVIQNHIKAIFELPSVNKENHVVLRQLVDGTLKHMRALNALGRRTEAWDDIIIYLLSTKLDSVSVREWQTSLLDTNMPSLKQMIDFLLHKCQALEAIDRKVPNGVAINFNARSKNTSSYLSTIEDACPMCGQSHFLFYCEQFRALSVDQRWKEVKTREMCVNCLRARDHLVRNCKSRSCKYCHKKQNTLLHSEARLDRSGVTYGSVGEIGGASTVVATTRSVVAAGVPQVLLPMALVSVYDKLDGEHTCRVLLDSGSQSNFITAKLAGQLDLKHETLRVSVTGIGQSVMQAHQKVKIKIGSRHNAFQVEADCIIVSKIADPLPNSAIKKDSIYIPRNIKLADPGFHLASGIDVLLGAELFWRLMCIGQIRRSREQPTLQKTHFGWIVSGMVPAAQRGREDNRRCHAAITNTELDNQLNKFWQLEDYGAGQLLTREEQVCEEHFVRKVRRNSQGRFVVSLPIREEKLVQLGESKEITLKRFYALERKLNKQPSLKEQYSSFLKEYLDLGHMRKVEESESVITPHYYLPHHAVIKESSATTKLRVVFYASCKTINSGTSLNDILRTGAVVQQDLMSIVTRFRTYRYVLNADISKMYRQIQIEPDQTALQRILWRNSSKESIETYELLTVAYGTAPASFLATRCLKYLAETGSVEYPRAAIVVARDFYMDDLLTGANSLEDAQILRDQIIQLLAKGCFQLRKWSSNSQELLQGVRDDAADSLLTIDKDANDRTLGLQWCTIEDHFRFAIPSPDKTWITKRVVLSRIARLFDPLGLIGPVITSAKLLMQQLWQLRIDWDASLPAAVHTEWLQFERSLQDLHGLRVPRSVMEDYPYGVAQIHGFCDASTRAYGACLYIRIKDARGRHSSRLLCSKSRVAPVKCTSLPRLELCGAVLLTQLMSKIVDILNLEIEPWLRSDSRRWNTFLANRVSEIQQRSDANEWRHVGTRDNPADLISRGSAPAQLAQSSLWWNGPRWLQADDTEWPDATEEPGAQLLSEQRKVVSNVAISTMIDDEDRVFKRYSDLDKLIDITALCRRFYKNCKDKEKRTIGSLTIQERDEALHALCGWVQSIHFQREIRALASNKQMHSSSGILKLSPFLDQRGILRVGDRLTNTDMPYAAKHQILLPAKHILTHPTNRQAHEKNLHAGTQATMAAIRQKYWIIAARGVVRGIIRKCIPCFKSKPVESRAVMGSLPSQRVQVSRPFSVCGVDYGGPLYIREGQRRNTKTIKAYMAVFVCFATKAVHIELASGLSSEAFIFVLKRFMARRGKVSHIYSDNGTNFVGAHSELQEFHRLFNEEQHKRRLEDFLRSDNITWHFIPPQAPNFGGLWEAAIKSTKTHLKRVIGRTTLSYEEMYTLLIQIEAVLNSRPITALSEDPSNDLSYLTPGHFLIGDVINSLVEPSLEHLGPRRLSRWQNVEQLRQHFWKRWQSEYLHQLQQRTKWNGPQGEALATGQLVLVRQLGVPPLQWILGRVTEVHPGSDGVVRTTSVTTERGILKPPISKLCILPLEL
ncbi:PREDICTED: uncharacterized protein LOC108775824 [Cyphomyrmex costatus]|uniref:uncharacterized protein LOC108775824 n=1 Tax=Cyphomyrmex costatus TaxID=456900 RepID=UPI000852264E|nr:PREDICTED: uncharacterized protein LOC108775824 [Cyphomyrmex costatus]